MENETNTAVVPEKKGGAFIALVGRISFITVLMFLAVYMLTVLSGSGAFFDDAARRSALLAFNTDREQAEEIADLHYNNLYEVAARLEYLDTADGVRDVMESYIGSPQFGDLRYYSQGKAYDVNGNLVTQETSAHDMIMALSASRTAGCTDIYRDKIETVDCIAFFVPVRGSAAVDGVLSVVPARNLLDVSPLLANGPQAVLLVDKSGRIMAGTKEDAFGYDFGIQLEEFVANFTNSESEIVGLKEALLRKNKEALPMGDYFVSLAPLERLGGYMSLVTVRENAGLIAPETEYIRHVINISVIAIVALLIGAVYALFYFKNAKKTLDTVTTTDLTVGCANGEEFRRTAGRLLRESGRPYAVAIAEVRRFRAVGESLPDNEVTEFLRYIAKVLETFSGPRETFGYMGDGKFLLLILRDNDRAVAERVRLIETICGKHAVLAASKTKRHFNIGVAETPDGRRSSVTELLDFAALALENAKNNVNTPFSRYTEELRGERDRADRIEAEMEAALANNEFRLFLQPKYNVAGDRVDSAEALVRWFDTKTGDYRFPGEFIGLFETNGFITKLDHYMYIETLKYLSAAAERGEKVVPISVNVSLVTVNDPGFLPFYIDNKKKYRIGDNFLCIEFTESFAMGDYTQIRAIVDALHGAGIRCSLDDFGSGYSSLGVLKNIPIDELKLDRLFLQPGFNSQYDDTMLATLISLAKTLGIPVVQEGVETKEMFESVIAKGCDIIQGYYYAKAIPVEEFRLFVGSNTSIKYKALVK